MKKKRNARKRKFHVFAEIYLKNSWNDFKELTLSGFKQKIRQKLIKKFEKLTVYTFPDNSLIYFLNMKRNEMTGNKNYMYLLTFFWKFHEMTSREFIFGWFKQFGTTVHQGGGGGTNMGQRQLSVVSDSRLLDDEIKQEVKVILRPKRPPRPQSEVFLDKVDGTRRSKRYSAFGVRFFLSYF